VLESSDEPVSVIEIEMGVVERLGPVPSSSIRSHLNAQTPGIFERTSRGFYRLTNGSASPEPREPLPAPAFIHDRVSLYEGDCFQLLKKFEPNSVQAVVTDPPYGLVEFSDEQLAKLRSRKVGSGAFRHPSTAANVRRFLASPS